MTEKPDYILTFDRPKNTEIKKIGNNWYLYERFSKYDPTIKRSRKISGRCLGKITPDGLIATKRRLTPAERPAAVLEETVEVGASLFMWKRTEDLRKRLQVHFPDQWQQIYVAALLRLLREPRFKRLQLHFENSILSHVFPKLSFTASDNAAMLRTLGKKRQAISSFMREDIDKKSAFILFDGHRLITSSKTMPFAELGYDSKQRYMLQINLLYIYSLDENRGAPVYYKQFIGSTPDVSAFADVLTESTLRHSDCTIIADKGFASESDFELLDSKNLKYVIPLRRGSRFVKSKLPLTPMSYENMFPFNGRAIQALKISEAGFNVFVFFDAQLYANELADAVERGEKTNNTNAVKLDSEMKRRAKGAPRLTNEELQALQPQDLMEIHNEIPEMGTVTIRTNRTDLNCMQVYRVYKQRQAIEQFFRTYRASLDFEASYMRTQATQEAWLFLNHLSSMMGMDCITDIAAMNEDKNISLEDLKQTLGKIMATRVQGEWLVAPEKRSVAKLLDKFDFNPSPELIEELLAEGTPH